MKKGVSIEANEEMSKVLQEVLEELKIDQTLPDDHPEKKRFNTLIDWMVKGGSTFDKLKLRYYSEDYRGVHAARNIAEGETILYVPKTQIITLEMAYNSPIGAQMYAKDLRRKLISPKHSFLSCYLMQDRRKEKRLFKEFDDILPKEYTNFPIFFKPEELKWLEGSPLLDQIADKIQDIKLDY